MSSYFEDSLIEVIKHQNKMFKPGVKEEVEENIRHMPAHVLDSPTFLLMRQNAHNEVYKIARKEIKDLLDRIEDLKVLRRSEVQERPIKTKMYEEMLKENKKLRNRLSEAEEIIELGKGVPLSLSSDHVDFRTATIKYLYKYKESEE